MGTQTWGKYPPPRVPAPLRPFTTRPPVCPCVNLSPSAKLPLSPTHADGTYGPVAVGASSRRTSKGRRQFVLRRVMCTATIFSSRVSNTTRPSPHTEALTGGPQCRLLILRNGNVPCHYFRHFPVDFKIV